MRFIVAVALVAAASSSANAAQTVTLAVAEGIAQIEHVDGLGRGIATGSEIGPVRIRLGDGSWAAIMLKDDNLHLTPAVSPVSRHPAPRDV